MPVVNVEDLVRLHRKPEDIRNVKRLPSIHPTFDMLFYKDEKG